MPLHAIELLSILCIMCEKSQFCMEKANTEIEATFSRTDVFTDSMQGLFLCI